MGTDKKGKSWRTPSERSEVRTVRWEDQQQLQGKILSVIWSIWEISNLFPVSLIFSWLYTTFSDTHWPYLTEVLESYVSYSCVTLMSCPHTPGTGWMVCIGLPLFWFGTCLFDAFTIELHVCDVLQLTIEKRKEIQQEKQKALDVQTRKQANRKKALLTRVQEILENVQVCEQSLLDWNKDIMK